MTSDSPQLIEPLTTREEEVLERLRRGLTNRQIARELDISPDGVKFHVSAILGKLGVRSRHEAAYWPEPAPWWAGGLAPLMFWWRRTAQTAGAKLSTATTWVAGGVLVAVVAALALLALLVLRGSDEGIAISNLTASGVQEDSVAAMQQLSSYNTAISVDETPIVSLGYAVPNDYRTISPAPIADTEDRFTVVEVLYVGPSVFVRQCVDVQKGCADWDASDRGDGWVGVPSPSFFPQWPIVALEMANDLSLEADGDELLVRGYANLTRAVLESERRVGELAGVSGFGTQCTGSPSEYLNGTPVQRVAPEPTSVCRDTTYEDMLEREADDIANGDANPASIEARIDPETYLIREFVVVNPPQDDDSPTYTLRFVYSDYNDVRIDVPEEFR